MKNELMEQISFFIFCYSAEYILGNRAVKKECGHLFNRDRMGRAQFRSDVLFAPGVTSPRWITATTA
jgi:hypothetical protein